MNVFLLLIPKSITFDGWDVNESTGNPVVRGNLDKAIARKFQRLGFPLHPFRMPGTRDTQGWQIVQIRGPLNKQQLLNRFDDTPLVINDLKDMCNQALVDYNSWAEASALLVPDGWYLISGYSGKRKHVIREDGTEVIHNDKVKTLVEVEQELPRWAQRWVADQYDENDVLIPRPYTWTGLHGWAGDEAPSDYPDVVPVIVPNNTDDEYTIEHVAGRCLVLIKNSDDYLTAINALPSGKLRGYLALDLLKEARKQARADRDDAVARIDQLIARRDILDSKIQNVESDLTLLVPDWQNEDFDRSILDETVLPEYLTLISQRRELRKKIRAVVERLHVWRDRKQTLLDQIDKLNLAIG